MVVDPGYDWSGFYAGPRPPKLHPIFQLVIAVSRQTTGARENCCLS
jgi:hypothetical protein